MADETRETKEENYEQDAYAQDAPQDVEQDPQEAEQPQHDGEEPEWRRDQEAEDASSAAGNYEEPAPELGSLNRDYTIPGVSSEETNPYRWHTGEKRDHGGEDAIEIIDVVKQFGRTRILNGLNLGLPDDQISMVLGRRAPASPC